jgi:FKBP-type peptidyl-prolyl cis-trans isomerase (trigger factor)
VPPSLVESEAKHMIERLKNQLGVEQMSDAEQQDLHKRILPEAENSVRLGYLLKSIGDKESIAVTDAEFAEEEKKSLEAAQTDEEKGKVKEFFGQHKREISNIVLERKVWKFLKDSAKIK